MTVTLLLEPRDGFLLRKTGQVCEVANVCNAYRDLWWTILLLASYFRHFYPTLHICNKEQMYTPMDQAKNKNKKNT